jgi:hypothetical protein
MMMIMMMVIIIIIYNNNNNNNNGQETKKANAFQFPDYSKFSVLFCSFCVKCLALSFSRQ